MRIHSYVAIALFFSQLGYAQNYTISTVAGGGFPNAIPATSASLGQVDGVAVDGAGNIYIANSTYSVVTMVDGSGNLNRIAGTGKAGFSGDNGPAESAQLNAARGLAVDSSGNIYIADSFNHRIRKISNGTITTVAGNGVPGYSGDNGPATNAQLNYPWAVAVDSAGTLFIADSGNHVIRKVSGGTITTFAGTGAPGAGSNNIPPTSGALNSPQGVAVDNSGNVYFSDTGNDVVRKVSGGTMAVLAGAGFGNVNLASPEGLAVDSSGNLYFALSGDDVVAKISGTSVTLFAGTGNTGFGGDGGPATSAAFNTPSSVAVDSSGRVLIADSLNGRIRRVASGTISTVAGLGTSGFVGDNGSAVGAQLYVPADVAADGDGNIYIADSENSRIRRVANGTITTIAGTGVYSSTGDGGAATAATVMYPTGIATDGSGNIYVADIDDTRVRKISGGVISTFAGTGTPGISTDGASAGASQLAFPTGVAADSGGNVFIAENGGFVNGTLVASRVRKVSSGVISTVAGITGGAGYSGDGGAATSAQLNAPYGVAVDDDGNLYIADTSNNRVRMIANGTGTITTIAGNGAAGFAGDGGFATGAQLNAPEGVTVDFEGNVYIADTGNNRIRMVSNGTITTIAGTGAATYSGDGGPSTAATLNGPSGVFVDQYGRVLVADTGNSAIRALTLPCSYGVPNNPLSATAAGGIVGLPIQTTPVCSWTVSNLPSWITFSGPSSGSGNATVNLQVDANLGAARSTTISVSGAQVTINQAAGCVYVLSSAGQAFPATATTANITVTVNPGCAWSASGGPSWVTITNGTNGTGNGTVNLSIAANSGGARSGSMTIAGQTFTLEQSAASIAGLVLGGSLAQVASQGTSQGTWTFTLNAINLGASGALTRFSFLDDHGAALALPMTFPQTGSSSGPLLASVLDRPIEPNAQLVIESTGQAVDAQVGSGLLQSNGGVTGFGIFSNAALKWNAVVPLETRNASSYILAFDNTGGLATGLAIANLSSNTANVPVIVRDDTGAVISPPNTTINLDAGGHNSFMLNQQYSFTVGKRGTVEFDTPQGGRISVLGLRAIGGALTTLPVLANVGTGGGSIAHATYNFGFTSIFYIVNTGNATSDFTLSFFDKDGSPLQAPLFLPQSGTNVTTATLTRTLAAGAMLVVETVADPNAATVEGSAQLTSTGNVSGFEIFRWTTFGQEASVPLETRSPGSYVLVFDDTNATTTGVAIANGAAAEALVTVNIRNDSGVLLKTRQINLKAREHQSFLLPDFDDAAKDVRGMVEFVVPNNGKISVIGLRAKADGTLTTIPVLTK